MKPRRPAPGKPLIMVFLGSDIACDKTESVSRYHLHCAKKINKCKDCETGFTFPVEPVEDELSQSDEEMADEV